LIYDLYSDQSALPFFPGQVNIHTCYNYTIQHTNTNIHMIWLARQEIQAYIHTLQRENKGRYIHTKDITIKINYLINTKINYLESSLPSPSPQRERSTTVSLCSENVFE